jgi:hypothetical protein
MKWRVDQLRCEQAVIHPLGGKVSSSESAGSGGRDSARIQPRQGTVSPERLSGYEEGGICLSCGRAISAFPEEGHVWEP